jgi:CRP-like cAMP-binding protein
VISLPRQEKDVVSSNLGTGDVFGWSSLVPPHIATAGAKSVSSCKILSLDCTELEKNFDEDCQFGYFIMQKIAQVIRDRLHNLRIETLAYTSG